MLISSNRRPNQGLARIQGQGWLLDIIVKSACFPGSSACAEDDGLSFTVYYEPKIYHGVLAVNTCKKLLIFNAVSALTQMFGRFQPTLFLIRAFVYLNNESSKTQEHVLHSVFFVPML